MPSSFIRTVTVGSGIGPDLLTSRRDRERSRARSSKETYRRWGVSPRPEDALEGLFRGEQAKPEYHDRMEGFCGSRGSGVGG